MNQPFSCRSHSGRTLIVLLLLAATVSTVRADYQSVVLNDHPVGYWSLDLNDPNAINNGLATDLTGNGNNGAYDNIYPGYNNVYGPSAFITNGVSFDGSTTYVDLSAGTSTSLLNFGGQISIEAWVQPSTPTAGGYVMGKGYDPSQNGDEIEMRLNNGSFHSGTYNFTTGDAGTTGGIETTNWTYLVSTYDGTNWNLYVNGALVATAADPVGALDVSTPWAIGAGTASGSSRIMNGNISQVALYTNALTSRQVLTHYFIGLDGTTNTPPIIARPPVSQVVPAGATVTFSCPVESLLPLTNQWYYNGAPLAGQTNATLVLSNVQTNNAGNYSVLTGNSTGSTNSTAASLTVNPQLINWQTPVVIGGAADVLTNGTYFGSWAPGDGSANSYPVNGVTFQGYSDLPGLSENFSGGGAGYGGFGSAGTASDNYNTLLQSALYAQGSGSSSFSWSGMTAGHLYEIQFWVQDARGYYARWENLTGNSVSNAIYGAGDDSAPVGYSSPLFSGAASAGYYIVGTFVADSAGSEEILLTPFSTGTGDSQINLFQVRDLTSVQPAQPAITGIHLSGTTLVISGTNGTSGHPFTVLTSTNLTLPMAQWQPLATNTFTGSNFSVTNTVNAGTPRSFYLLRAQ